MDQASHESSSPVATGPASSVDVVFLGTVMKVVAVVNFCAGLYVRE